MKLSRRWWAGSAALALVIALAPGAARPDDPPAGKEKGETAKPSGGDKIEDVVNAQAKYAARAGGRTRQSPQFLRQLVIAALARLTPEERTAYFKTVPRTIRADLDLLYVSPAEKEAAEKLPESAKEAAEKLAGSDIPAMVTARRQLLGLGDGARALVAERARKLPDDSPLHIRFTQILHSFDQQAKVEHRLRVVEEAWQRAAALSKDRENSKAKVAALVAYPVAAAFGENAADPYYLACYYSFANGGSQFKAPTGFSIRFVAGDNLQVAWTQGQYSVIKDRGKGDLSSVTRTPSRQTMKQWPASPYGYKAVPGNVYLMRWNVPSAQIDEVIKFKVLELKPGEYVVIEWEMMSE